MEPEQPDPGELVLSLHSVQTAQRPDGGYEVRLQTSRGTIACEFFVCEGSPGAVIWSAGRRRSPAESTQQPVYANLAQELVEDGISSLRIYYRWPGAEPGPFEECVLDTLGGVSFLTGIGARGIALVGHSFSGGVVIRAATLTPHVTAVVALASQLYGTQQAALLAPRPLLLVHGTEDTVLDYASSQIIYDRAGEPKELILIEGAGHSFREQQDELRSILQGWLISKVGPQALVDTA